MSKLSARIYGYVPSGVDYAVGERLERFGLRTVSTNVVRVMPYPRLSIEDCARLSEWM